MGFCPFVRFVLKIETYCGNESCCHFLRASAPLVHHDMKMAVTTLAATALTLESPVTGYTSNF